MPWEIGLQVRPTEITKLKPGLSAGEQPVRSAGLYETAHWKGQPVPAIEFSTYSSQARSRVLIKVFLRVMD